MLMIEMDTSVPLKKLLEIVVLQLGRSWSNQTDIYLQDLQLDPSLSLYDQGVKVSGNVELSVQWENNESDQRLTIVEIAKNMTDTELKEFSGSSQKNSDQSSSSANNILTGNSDEFTTSVPTDPTKWTPDQVHMWMLWVAKGYDVDLDVIKRTDIDGKTLCELPLEEFFVKFPYGNIFWSHLSILKKKEHMEIDTTGIETTVGSSVSMQLPTLTDSRLSNGAIDSSLLSMTVQLPVLEQEPSPTRPVLERITVASNTRTPSSTGGQIQLWQFLLELLTDANERSVIRWVGNDGEFKFLSPEKVAQKWGARKGKPAMNYEKLSRALRYYYDGDMISKVSGKRFQYKFVCNLKEILGFDAAELNKMVVECYEKRHSKSDVI